jgi:hypothetical protein
VIAEHEERTDYPYWLGVRSDTWWSWVGAVVLAVLMIYPALPFLIVWWRLH